MAQDLERLLAEAEAAVSAAADLQALDGVRVRYLGKSGSFTDQLKQLGKLPAEQRPQAGQAINAAKQRLQQAIETRRDALEAAALSLMPDGQLDTMSESEVRDLVAYLMSDGP